MSKDNETSKLEQNRPLQQADVICSAMMTKEQKERKMKLIYLIMIVNTEYVKRKPFKNIWETISFACEQVWWAMELKRVAAQKTF